MGTQTQQIWEWIGKNIWQILVFGSLFIQISPIKINPWSAIFKWIGKMIVGETSSKIDDLVKKFNTLEAEVKENEKDRIRWEILDFANSCHNGRRHTQDEFKHIIELNDKYTALLTQTNDSNGIFKIEYRYILELYEKLLANDEFLR